MNKNYNTIGKIRLAMRTIFMAIAAVLLSGCTLMLDELEVGNDTPKENGDGFTSPKTVEDEGSIVTYQFKEGTVLLDETYRKYINNVVSTDTLGGVEITFSKDIPSKMMPQRGNGLVTELHDIFGQGLNHKVDFVENIGKGYRVAAHVVNTKEIYKTLKFKIDGFITKDDPETRSGDGGFAGTLERSRSEGQIFEIPLFDFSCNIIGGLSFSNADLDKRWDGSIREMLDAKKVFPDLDGPVSLNGEINAGLGLSLKGGLRLHCEYDSEKDFVEFWMVSYSDIFAGAYADEIKGTVSVALYGSQSPHQITHTGKGLPKFVSNVEHWLFRYSPKHTIITSGPLFVDIYPSVNLVVDFFGSLKTEKPISYGYRSSSESKPYGFRYKDGKLTILPESHQKGKETSDTEATNLESLSFIFGSQLHANIGTHFLIEGLFDIAINGDATATFTYDKTIYSSKNNFTPPKFNENKRPSPLQDSKLSFDTGMSFSLDGKVSLGFTELDLFSLKAIPPFTVFSWSKPLRNDYELASRFLPENSSTKESHYSIRVNNMNDGLFQTKKEPKYIAFYTDDGEYITYRPLFVENDLGRYENALEQEIEIVLPADYSEKYGKTVTAVLYNENNQFATPSKFALAGGGVSILNARQIDVINAEQELKLTSGQQVLGLAFKVKGETSLYSFWGDNVTSVRVSINDSDGYPVDYEGHNLYFGRDGTINKDFLMFIKTPIGKEYIADIEIWNTCYSSVPGYEKKTCLAKITGVELLPYSFPEEVYDFNNPGSWSEYEIMN